MIYLVSMGGNICMRGGSLKFLEGFCGGTIQLMSVLNFDEIDSTIQTG